MNSQKNQQSVSTLKWIFVESFWLFQVRNKTFDKTNNNAFLHTKPIVVMPNELKIKTGKNDWWMIADHYVIQAACNFSKTGLMTKHIYFNKRIKKIFHVCLRNEYFFSKEKSFLDFSFLFFLSLTFLSAVQSISIEASMHTHYKLNPSISIKRFRR